MTDQELNEVKADMFYALTQLLKALAAIATTAHEQVVAAAVAEGRKAR
jgi:hypothetical protein